MRNTACNKQLRMICWQFPIDFALLPGPKSTRGVPPCSSSIFFPELMHFFRVSYGLKEEPLKECADLLWQHLGRWSSTIQRRVPGRLPIAVCSVWRRRWFASIWGGGGSVRVLVSPWFIKEPTGKHNFGPALWGSLHFLGTPV